jgi:hypothetical protein
MTHHESPGFLRRMLTSLGDSLQRGILGRSAPAYMKQFSGSDEYWDRAIAAQCGWPGQAREVPVTTPGARQEGTARHHAPAKPSILSHSTGMKSQSVAELEAGLRDQGKVA